MGKSFSVIIPNYNQGDYLAESVNGLLRQSRQPDEILVVDDGSTDHSLEVLKRLALEELTLRYISLPTNQGVATACELGLQAARGELVYHSAADDPVLPKFVENSAELLERYPQAGLCVTDFRGVHPNGDWETVRFGIAPSPCYIPPQRLREFAQRQDFFNLPTHTATYYRQRQLECGGIIKPLKWHHDWFVAIVVALRHGICYHPETLKVLRWDSNSYSFTGQRDREAQQEVLGTLFDLLLSPAYADVADFFKTPSVLGRFGFKMVDMLLSREHLWPFFSWELFSRALQGENAFFEKKDFRDLRQMDRPRQIEAARGIMEQVAQQIEKVAENLVLQRNYEDAIIWYYRLCDIRPRSGEAAFRLGSCLWRAGWAKEALLLFERAAGLDPASEEIRRALGKARADAQRQNESCDQWSGPWGTIWGKRDWSPYRVGKRQWAGPADTRPATSGVSSVSALVWNLGAPEELEATLGDLAAQSLMPEEVIIVGEDPGPVHQAWGHRLPRLGWSPGPGGEQEAPWSQRPMSLVRGEYLLFLAAGDRLAPDYLARAVEAMEQAPKVGACLTPLTRQEGDGQARLLSPLELAEMGDDDLVLERGVLLRREATRFPLQPLAKIEWLGGWFLALFAALSRGACLLPRPLLNLNPTRVWAGEPAGESFEAGQRRARVMGALLNTVMVSQLRYLRPLLAYGGFLARVGPSLIKATMAMSHLWSADTLMVMQYPLHLWGREKALRAEAARAAAMETAQQVLERGRSEVRQGRLRQAHATFSRLAVDYPEMGAAPAALAVLAGAKGDHAQARDLLEEACRREPGNPLPLVQLGRAYQRLGQERQARQAFNQALAMDPGNQEALGSLRQMAHTDHAN